MSAFPIAFAEAEAKAMHFLVADHGFRPQEREAVETSGTQAVFASVTYVEARPTSQSHERFVRLSMAPLRLELDLDIGFGRDRKQYFTIHELHQLIGSGALPPRTHDMHQAMHDSAQLAEEFEVLAAVLRDAGARFFSGDPSLWEDLRKQRLTWAKSRDDMEASKRAEGAFKAKEWRRVVDLLSPIEETLGRTDAARLRYARKQLG